jgi:predicted RNA-binding Zn ribbon-like protein
MLANTLDWRLREQPVELLREPEDLLRWAWSAGVMELAEAEGLRAWCAEHPRRAARAFERARTLREAVADIFQARASGAPIPEGAALAILERVYLEASNARALRAHGATIRWEWRNGKPSPKLGDFSKPRGAPLPSRGAFRMNRVNPKLERIAWAVALDAVRLLTGPEGDRVRQCADAQCGWFFLDESRNRSRRWCSMEACGNRNKARRFYRRASSPPRDHPA